VRDGIVEVAACIDSWRDSDSGTSWGTSDRRERLLELRSAGAIDDLFRWNSTPFPTNVPLI
jgi:hypothetical protein